MNRETRIFITGWIIILVTGIKIPEYLQALLWGDPHLGQWIVSLTLIVGFFYGIYEVQRVNEKPKDEVPEAYRCSCGVKAREVKEFGHCGKCMEV